MLTNFIPKGSLKSPYGKTYVVRATIKAPLPKDSPLREGTVGYTFSKEYQQTLQEIALRSKEETKGANLLFSADQAYRESILKKEGVEFYDIFGNTGATKTDREYVEKCRKLVAPGGADKYFQQLEVTHKGNPQALEDAKTSLNQNLEQKKALVERFDALDQQRANATKVAENIRNMKSLPGLLTPEQHEAEIRAELAQKIKEANEVDVKLAKKFRAM